MDEVLLDHAGRPTVEVLVLTMDWISFILISHI